VPDWIAEAEANLGGPDPSHLVFLLVGHKADLDAKREVLFEEGEYLAKHRKIKFVETSALTGDNVNVSFEIINYFYSAINRTLLFYRKHSPLLHAK
jgi:GTPase SAR1 family protein